MSPGLLSKTCLPLVCLLTLACDKAAHRPPAPDEGVPPAAAVPGASSTTGDSSEPPGFAGELVPPAVDSPPPPAGQSKIGRFDLLERPGATAVFEHLRKWVADRSGKLHAAVLDLESGHAVALHRAAEPVNPASNMKLLTAAAALDLLGPAYTFKTELLGRVDDAGLAKVLVLRGGGDPALSSAEIFRLAQSAHAQGLRRVARLDVDQSLFDTPFVPPAFEQQPREWAAFRAPISAAAIDGNTVTLNVAPTEAGQPARAWYEPPGVVEAVGSVETRAVGSGDQVVWTLDPSRDPTRPLSSLAGGIGAHLPRQRYMRRLDDPRRAAGLVLRHWLLSLGVEVEGEVGLTGPPGPREAGSAPPRLSYVSSAPLAELLLPLGKDSDNFTAEMTLVALSRTLPDGRERSWSSARGVSALRAWLERGGIPLQGIALENGSGLFDANRVTVETLALVLARMEGRPEVFAEYLSQLAIYGTDGTLRQRMLQNSERGRVRAKTGTLSRIDALSGYILRPSGMRPVVFSLVVSGVSGGHAAVRQALDRAVFGWAEALSAPNELQGSASGGAPGQAQSAR
jgi:D-alanyl-D-alanine carboxypeptidase/D-alanyl-D-alanine-endopeptidase (penicillin-binding protein 4)